MDEEEEESIVVGWAGIYVTFIVSVAQFAVFYFFFLRQRSQEKAKTSYDLYEPRQNTRPHRSPPPFEASWWRSAYNVSQEDLLRQVGLDSYMFLRLLRLGARFTGLGSVWAILLMIVYATGDARGDSTEQFNQLTLARVEANSHRLFASVLVWYVMVAFLLRELVKEWQLYAQNRYAFLATGDVDMPREYRYAIRVEQVPRRLRSDEALTEYFERLFPGKVWQATAYRQTDEVQKLLDERHELLLKYEAAEAVTRAKPDQPRPTVSVGGGMCGGGNKVDAMEHYKAEIERLNQEIDDQRATFVNVDDKKLVEDSDGSPVEDGSSGIEVQKVDMEKGSTQPTQEEGDSNNDDDKTASTAFVTFTSLRAKQAAIQCELTGDPNSMVVVPAPDPKGIIWDNVTVPRPQQQVLQVQAAAFWCLGILFWAIPVSFVTSIANLNSILETLGFEPADPNVFWYGLVSGLLPVIALAILMAVLYMAITAAATHFVRFKSWSEVDSYSFYWHQLFQFANLWLILIGGSLFNQIDAFLEADVGSIVGIIVDAMPGASVFFVNMIQVGTFGAFGLELSMLPTYGVTLIMNLLQPQAMRTQRQLDEAQKPPSLVWGQHIPPITFIFLVVLLYCTIVPIMEIFGFLYFAGMYLVWKHQCLHVYAQEFEGGGEATWQALFGFLMACLYMGEFVFIAYMGLKEAPTQSAMGFVPVAVTVIVHYWLTVSIIRPLRNLSLEVAANVDIADGELTTADRSSGGSALYGQPTLDATQDEREPMPYRRVSKNDDDNDDDNAEKAAVVNDAASTEGGPSFFL